MIYIKSDHLFELAFLIQNLYSDVKITESGYYLTIRNAVSNGCPTPSRNIIKCIFLIFFHNFFHSSNDVDGKLHCRL